MASFRADTIPLFPLPLVLLPGELLPLHIFEERYKRMVTHSLETGETFGIVLQVGDGVAAVGCSARLVGVLEELPDGRLNIIVQGQEAFRLTEVRIPADPETEALAGSVEYLEDEEGDAADEAVAEAERLVARIRKLEEEETAEESEGLELAEEAESEEGPSFAVAEGTGGAGDEEPASLPPESGSPASYQLVAGLEVEAAFKQRLLQLRDESKRLELVLEYLRTFVSRLELLIERKESIRGNGKAY